MSMIPTNNFVSWGKGCSKVKCDGCDNLQRVRGIVRVKGKYLCYPCRQKILSFRLQESAGQIGRPKINLKQALEKEYSVHKYLNKQRNTYQHNIGFPTILIGHTVKIELIDGDNISEELKKYISEPFEIVGKLRYNKNQGAGIEAVKSFHGCLYGYKFKLKMVEVKND